MFILHNFTLKSKLLFFSIRNRQFWIFQYYIDRLYQDLLKWKISHNRMDCLSTAFLIFWKVMEFFIFEIIHLHLDQQSFSKLLSLNFAFINVDHGSLLMRLQNPFRLFSVLEDNAGFLTLSLSIHLYIYLLKFHGTRTDEEVQLGLLPARQWKEISSRIF